MRAVSNIWLDSFNTRIKPLDICVSEYTEYASELYQTFGWIASIQELNHLTFVFQSIQNMLVSCIKHLVG